MLISKYQDILADFFDFVKKKAKKVTYIKFKEKRAKLQPFTKKLICLKLNKNKRFTLG